MFLWIPDQIGIWKCWFLSRGIQSTPQKNLSEQGREPITNSTNVIFCRQLCNSNLGHIGGKLVVSLLHHSPLSLLERLLIQSVASLFKEQLTTFFPIKSIKCIKLLLKPVESNSRKQMFRCINKIQCRYTVCLTPKSLEIPTFIVP